MSTSLSQLNKLSR